MNTDHTPDPYRSPRTRSTGRPTGIFLGLITTLVWFAIPIGLVVGRRVLTSMFMDFEVELPFLTAALLNLVTIAALAAIATGVSVMAFSGIGGERHKLLVWTFLLIGVLLLLACAMLMIAPLATLITSLS